VSDCETEEPAARQEIIASLMHANATAKRMQQIVGTPKLPTMWDRAHRYIDTLLDQLVGR
jgi:hypothetical protein